MSSKGNGPQLANTVTCQSNMPSEQFKFNSTLQNGFPNNNQTSFLYPMNYNFISNSNIINGNSNNINSSIQSQNNSIDNQNINQSLANYQNFNLNPQNMQTQISPSSKFSMLSYQNADPQLTSTFTPFLQPKQSMEAKIGSLNPSTKQKKIRKLFSVEEDHLLTTIMYGQPFTTWIAVAAQIPGRTARQCRDRWANYLSPNNKNGPWSQNEDEILAEKHKEYGPQWTIISKFFDGRSENNVKNRWYTHLKHKYYGKSINNDFMKINTLPPNARGQSNYSDSLKNQHNLQMLGNNNNYGNLYYYGDQVNTSQQMNNMNSNIDSSNSFKKFPHSENSLITNNNNKTWNPQASTPYIDPNLRASNSITQPGITTINSVPISPMLYNQNNINSMNFSNTIMTSSSSSDFTSTSKSTTINSKRAPLPPISSLVS